MELLPNRMLALTAMKAIPRCAIVPEAAPRHGVAVTVGVAAKALHTSALVLAAETGARVPHGIDTADQVTPLRLK